MGFTVDLLAGVAQRLDAAGVGVWRTTGVYDDTEVGIVLGVPGQSPPAVIALAVYRPDDHPALSDSIVGMQARFRGPDADPRGADDLADGVFDELQGLHGVVLNGVRLVYAKRVSSLPLGISERGQQERTDNYDLKVHRPSKHRE